MTLSTWQYPILTAALCLDAHFVVRSVQNRPESRLGPSSVSTDSQFRQRPIQHIRGFTVLHHPGIDRHAKDHIGDHSAAEVIRELQAETAGNPLCSGNRFQAAAKAGPRDSRGTSKR